MRLILMLVLLFPIAVFAQQPCNPVYSKCPTPVLGKINDTQPAPGKINEQVKCRRVYDPVSKTWVRICSY